MKFGIFYEHQLPRPWGPTSEYQLLQDSLTQIELADRLGYDYAWEVEHHFLEEYSHCPAPELFLTACAMQPRQSCSLTVCRCASSRNSSGIAIRPSPPACMPMSFPTSNETRCAHWSAESRVSLTRRLPRTYNSCVAGSHEQGGGCALPSTNPSCQQASDGDSQ